MLFMQTVLKAVSKRIKAVKVALNALKQLLYPWRVALAHSNLHKLCSSFIFCYKFFLQRFGKKNKKILHNQINAEGFPSII